MGYLRVRRRVKVAPGVKINLNKKSASISVGPKGAHYTVSSNGTRTKTGGIPGTGVSYVDRQRPRTATTGTRANPSTKPKSTAAPVRPRKASKEVAFGNGGGGKVRSVGKGLLLSVLTLGTYYYFWYYRLNDELKDIGIARSDRKLSESRPGLSVAAVWLGGYLVIPASLSIYNFGQRIKHAEHITGVPQDEQINPTVVLLTALLGVLVVPLLYHFAYVTKHQNRIVVAAGRPRDHDHVLQQSVAAAEELETAQIKQASIEEPEPDFTVLAAESGDVARTIAERDHLIAEKPRLWEYRLFASELFLGVWSLEPTWNAYCAGEGQGVGDVLDRYGTRDCLAEALDRVSKAIGQIEGFSSPQVMERVFGKPGEPGNPAEIQAYARRTTSAYEQTLGAVSSVRAQTVPPEFAKSVVLLSDFIGGPLTQTRKFVANTVRVFDNIVKEHNEQTATGGPPKRVELNFVMWADPEIRAELEAETRRAFGQS